MTQNWIDEIISKGTLMQSDGSLEYKLCRLLLEKCDTLQTDTDLGILYAASFDLLVAAEYYTFLSHKGWLYCPSSNPRIYFHFTNCCPRHVLNNEFFFHPSNKPTSGIIGTATSKLLLLLINCIFENNKFAEKVYRGIEPVDAIIINHEQKKVLFAEIKASPLLTLSLSIDSERLTQELNGEVIEEEHTSLINSQLYSQNLEILVPVLYENIWQDKYYTLGNKKDEKDKEWAFRSFLNLIENNDSFFTDYINYWKHSLQAYFPRNTDDIFWLTNSCGTPSPIPDGWQKRRNGSGYESISDSKTSVGMDRTDDIKKGIYQVLKLGSVGKLQSSSWDYKVGIISNIHPARHFQEYLESLKDIIWTNDESGRVKKANDLPPNQNLYNLFDGIIAFTSTHSRDSWLDDLFIRPLSKL